MSNQSGKRRIAATPSLVSERLSVRGWSGWIRAAVFSLLLGMLTTGAMTWFGVLYIPANGVEGHFGIDPDEPLKGSEKSLPIAYGQGNWLVSERIIITPNASGDQIIVSSEFSFGWPFRTVRHVGRRTEAASAPVSSSIRFAADAPGRYVSWGGVVANAVLFSGVWFVILYFRSAKRQFTRWLASRRAWRCPECRYDLRGCPDPGCPECGWKREEGNA